MEKNIIISGTISTMTKHIVGSIQNNGYFFISIMTTIASMFLFNVSTTEMIFKDLAMNWNATHYAINYSDFGFVKRGLVGSIYQWLDGSFSQESLFLFQLSFLFILLAITHSLFSQLQLNRSYVYLLFILSPAVFMQFGFDIGRFDPLLVSFFMLSIIYRRNTLLFLTFSILGILTHEIYVFALLPASFLLYLTTKTDLVSFKNIVVGSLKASTLYILLAFILLLILFGSYEQGYEHILNMFAKSGLPDNYIEVHNVNNLSSLHIWTRSILDNLAFTSQIFELKIATVYMLVIYLIILIYFAIIGVKFSQPKYFIILLSSLPMFFLGTDWARWLAFIYISLFVVFITTERDKAAELSNKYLLLFSLYGPLGISGYLPPVMASLIALYKM